MSKPLGGNAGENSDDNSSADDGSYFAWEFVNDEPQRQVPLTPSVPIATVSVKPSDKKQSAPVNRVAKPLQRNDGASNVGTAQNKGQRSSVSTPNTRFPQARVNYIRDQLDKALD